uniref:DDE_3 domain-containing protein n=1 Tax=Heterorhabditis bacteriophora TaxID=37862 RepID=A0A1I7WBM5_HETBA
MSSSAPGRLLRISCVTKKNMVQRRVVDDLANCMMVKKGKFCVQRRITRSASMKSCPQVIQEHKDERLCWAKIFMRCNWEKVFNLDGPDGCHSYWRNLRKEPRHCSTRNFGGGSLMIWGTFSAMGLVDLAFVSTKMNSTGYQDACAHYLVPYLQRFPDVSFTLQQNNATIHASRNTKT